MINQFQSFFGGPIRFTGDAADFAAIAIIYNGYWQSSRSDPHIHGKGCIVPGRQIIQFVFFEKLRCVNGLPVHADRNHFKIIPAPQRL